MILILVLALTFGWSNALLAQTPFYQGKTITIAVGTKAGDVYDLYPRLLAEYLDQDISRAIPTSSCKTSPAPPR